MSHQQVLIPCEVSQGMFDNEFAVEITLPSQKIVSLFVDKSLIQKEGSQYYLKTYLMENSEKDDATVLLPTESFEQGTRWLKMPSANLVPA